MRNKANGDIKDVKTCRIFAINVRKWGSLRGEMAKLWLEWNYDNNTASTKTGTKRTGTKNKRTVLKCLLEICASITSNVGITSCRREEKLYTSIKVGHSRTSVLFMLGMVTIQSEGRRPLATTYTYNQWSTYSTVLLLSCWGIYWKNALKGTVSQDFCFWFFSWISFPPAPEYTCTIRIVSNFFKKLQRLLWLKIFSICHRCQRHRWCILSCEYLHECSKKFGTALTVYSGDRRKLIHEKTQKSKISWWCPFKGTHTQAWNILFYFFCRNRTLWSQGLVTRNFWKSYWIRPRYSNFKIICYD